MFIEYKQLKQLNVPAGKIDRLHSAASRVQLAFAGYQPQLCQAYLLQVSGGEKVLIMVAFYLSESQSSIFFVPKFGELPVEAAGKVYEEGYTFVESMGFVLTETDYHLLPELKKQSYWAALPICQPVKQKPQDKYAITIKSETEMKSLRRRSIKSLGRFFASM